MSEESLPNDHMPELDLLIGKADDPVPSVDPADLKKLWTYSQEVRAKYGNRCVATGIEVLKLMCSPGADTRAVSYRCSMLGLLEMMLESAWAGGQLSENAFTVAAQMELKWMGVGEVYRGLPFDAGEFLGQVHGVSLYKQGATGQETV